MRRLLSLVLPALAAGTLLLGACTDPRAEVEPDALSQDSTTLTRFEAGVVEPIVGADWQAALQASQEVFSSSPVVFLAPMGDDRAQKVAREHAASAGVPVLLTPGPEAGSDDVAAAVREELSRLGAEVVVTVGEVAESDENDPWTPIPMDVDPGHLPPNVPSVTSDPAADVVALVSKDPEYDAASATIEAAGIPLLRVAEPGVVASAETIEFLAGTEGSAVLTVGGEFDGDPSLDWQIRAAQTGYHLPGGGQLIFDDRQYVALYGTPNSSDLGVLGHQGLDDAVERVHRLSAEYQDLSEHTVVSSFEVITTVASAFPGTDGNYSNELPKDELRPWIERAGDEGMLVILDLQPGRTDFLTQAKEYQDLLELPHVGLALDPEWRLKSDQVHLVQIGSVTTKEINEVTTWLADLVNEQGLPQKMVVLHQFRTDMISDRQDLDLSRPELALLIHADGQGSQPAKQDTWWTLHQNAPEGIRWGWKNFYEMDEPMLTPEQTMQVEPLPELITYQ